MAGKNVTRMDQAEAVYQAVDVPRAEAAELIGHVLEEICAALIAGKKMKLSGFGILTAREKGPRIGRNVKIGEVVPIEARRSILQCLSCSQGPREWQQRETPPGVEPNGASCCLSLICNAGWVLYSGRE